MLERVDTVAYRLALPPSMSGVHEVFHVSMLRRYTPDPAHVVDWGEIEVDIDETFEEGPVCILDSRDQVLRRKTVRLVRVLWRHCGVEESTWEYEDTMRATNPFLFRDEGTWFSRLRFKWLVTCRVECTLHMHVSERDCPEFRDEIRFKEGRM